MGTLYYQPQYKLTTLNVPAGLNASQTTGIILDDIARVDADVPGIVAITYANPLDLDEAEYVGYTSISVGKELQGVTRDVEGTGAHAHVDGATVAFVHSKSHINNILDKLRGVDAVLALDVHGNEVIKTAHVDSAVNEITVSNAATGAFPTIQATGEADTGIDFENSEAEEILKLDAQATAVNELTVKNAAANAAPTIEATGDDTNIDIQMKGKGTGHLQAYSQNDAAYFDVVPNSSMSRQAIMNGNFDVWQRGTSATAAEATAAFLADRWKHYHTAGGGTLPTLTVSRQALTPGDIANAFYCMRLTTNGAGTSLGTSSIGEFWQAIEHGTRYLCGLNKKVTVSFWAKSDISNKKLGFRVSQSYGTGGSPTSAESINGSYVTLTSTWTKYSYTFTTNTLVGKTFGTANDDMLVIYFHYMWGTDYDDLVGITGAETYVGAGYIDIAQVQLCAGDVALPFQPKSYAQELQDCLRFYYRLSSTEANYAYFGSGAAYSATQAYALIPFKVKMRSIPTLPDISAANTFQVHQGTPTGVALDVATPNGVDLLITLASGMAAEQAINFYANNTANAYLGFDAEL